jgi:hypothetical protein
MLHYTCDLCGKDMLPGDDRRFTVKMEVFAAHDPAELTEADLDQDHMDEIGEMLEEMEDREEKPESPTPSYKKLQYDLCPACHKKFLGDPLGKESAHKFHFSEN